MADLTDRQAQEAPPDIPELSSPLATSPTEREPARKRLEARQGLSANVVCYLVVNAFLVCVWAFTGAGYFWPAWVMAAWGIGVVMHVWDVYFRRPITEADIDKELRRG